MSIAVQLAALAASGYALVHWTGGPSSWLVGAFVVALALSFDEASRRAARMRIRLSASLRTDMASVWGVAVSASLPRGVAVCVLATIFTYDWFRHHRPAGERLERKSYVLGSVLLASLAASTLSHAARETVLSHSAQLHAAPLAETFTAIVAIIVYSVVQRSIVTLGLLTLQVRGRVLLGTRDDNLIEFATLCLGGLVALTLHYQPVLAVLALAPMITLHRGALVRELETAAATDAKTGLLNAVAWEHLAQREIARAERDRSELAVLLVDVDHFKAVNDEYGHLVGDQVLRGIGRELTSVLRRYDSAGRFGGEEFVVVLPDASCEAALQVAERARRQINALTVGDLLDDGPDAAAHDRLAVSIGVACLGEHGAELTDLLQAADVALYRAKTAGRNQVVLAGDPTGETPETVVPAL